MNIVKSLHSSLLHKYFSYQEKHYFTVSILWGFNLHDGKPVLEQELWQTIGEMLGKNDFFDVGMPKQNAEVLVHGSYYSPEGEPVNASRVSVSLGEISKELLVFGNRYWIKGMGIGWGVSDPEPYTEMSITYSNAFGGEGYAPNPVGKGIVETDLNGEPVFALPNIEYADELIGAPGDRPRPASLNRTDMLCEQRMSYAGTYDQNYIETRMPGFPDDLNYDYFNDAALDQWKPDFFTGNESFEIRNMHPDHSVIKGQLPTVYGRAFVDQLVENKIEFKEIPTQLDTVWFFPSADLGVLIYRGTVEVQEDDASDIKKILVANENIGDTPRKLADYQTQLVLRTDPEESFKYLLYTAPLIPEGCRCGFETIVEDANFPLENLANQNMANFIDSKRRENEAAVTEKMEEIRAQLKDSGLSDEQIDTLIQQMNGETDAPAELSPEMQEITKIADKILPGMLENPDNLDLSKLNLKAIDELNAYLEKMQITEKDKARQNLVDQLEELKRNNGDAADEKSALQLEQIIENIDLPPELPRIDLESLIAKIKGQAEVLERQLMVMQSMGLPESELEKMKSSLDVEASEKQTREGFAKALDGYRIGAHCIEKSRSPHAGQENEIRESLVKAYQTGGKTASGDYAFVDLSNLDLSGIDLSCSYLEYADLSNTNLTNANLSKAILAHAIVKNTQFTNTNLSEANLGSIHFEGGEFDNANLTDATLSKSTLSNTTFKHCKMAEKVDMFHETLFSNTSFIECDLRKNVFIDIDISGCNFSGSDLTECNFVNPIMTGAIFSQANLSGVNFVKAEANESKFDYATMKNVRFVAESSLARADFQFADVSEANLMNCNLQDAKFGKSILHKSDFGGANLKNANFEKAQAVQSQFNKANLTFTNLNKIDLMEGSLHKAVLSGASFKDANLYNVNFLGCTVGETDFSGAYLEQTIFKDWRP
jgi:uncharacterized protein YjbI with pentapeptide repeats